MTKFDKSEKSDGPVSSNKCSGFDSFRVKIRRKENTRRFEAQKILWHGKGASRSKYRRN
jgi:hypothetical protein